MLRKRLFAKKWFNLFFEQIMQYRELCSFGVLCNMLNANVLMVILDFESFNFQVEMYFRLCQNLCLI